MLCNSRPILTIRDDDDKLDYNHDNWFKYLWIIVTRFDPKYQSIKIDRGMLKVIGHKEKVTL